MITSAAWKRCVGTILNRRWFMRLIRLRLKTCEMKGRRTVLDAACEFLVFHMSKPCREKGCRYHIVARLIERAPLGPFRSGAEVLAAGGRTGYEFKTGMNEAELDAFIANQSSGEVWVYRFEDAMVTDAVEWDDRPGNNNSGFLPAYNGTRRRMRFRVDVDRLIMREEHGMGEGATATYNDESGCEVVRCVLFWMWCYLSLCVCLGWD